MRGNSNPAVNVAAEAFPYTPSPSLPVTRKQLTAELECERFKLEAERIERQRVESQLAQSERQRKHAEEECRGWRVIAKDYRQIVTSSIRHNEQRLNAIHRN